MKIVKQGWYRCRSCAARFALDFGKEIQSPLLVQVGYHVCDTRQEEMQGVGDLIAFVTREQTEDDLPDESTPIKFPFALGGR